MAASENDSRSKPRGGGEYGRLPEELALEILKRLRSSRSVGRSRCVSKSWYRLLSDPNFIRGILFFDNQIESGAQILITRRPQEHPDFAGRGPTIYSKLYYHTLQPSAASSAIAPFSDLLTSPTIAGCCHGIFCIYGNTAATNNNNPNYDQKIMLWNPTTSETKILPPLLPSNVLGLPSDRQPSISAVGFGLDPITNDYKVVAVTRGSHRASNTASVYNLSKDSWRRPKFHGSIHDTPPPNISSHVLPVAQSHSPALHHKCHWSIPYQFYSPNDEDDWFFTLASFDTSEEKFETFKLHGPGDHYDRNLLSIVKESLVSVVSVGESFESMRCSYQVSVALDYELGLRCSLIRLFTVSSFPAYCSKLFYGVPALWKHGRCFVVGGDEKLRVVNPHVAEDRYRLAIEAKWYSFRVVTYVPSTISLSSS